MNRTFFRLLWLALLFTGSTCFAQKTAFQRTIGGSGEENSYSIERTLDGGYISVGHTTSFGSGSKDVYLVKTNGIGQVEWSKAYGGKNDEQGWKVVPSSDSGFVVVGTTNSFRNNNDDALMFKTDKNGTVSWVRTFASDSAEDAYSVISSVYSKGYYVVGYVKNDSTGNDAFLAKLGSLGNVRWYKKFGSKGNEEAYTITEDNKGNVLVCGVTTYDSITQGGISGTKGDSDGFMAKFDSTGNFKWMRTYGTDFKDQIWDVKADRNDYYMLGWSMSAAGDNDVTMIKTDTSGSVVATGGYGSNADDRAFNMQIVPGNRISIGGYTQPFDAPRDVMHLYVNTALALQTYSIIGGGDVDGHWPTDVTTARDGGIVILSTSRSFNSTSNDDLYIIKADETGTVNCNSNFALVNQNNFKFTSRSFGSVTAGYGTEVPTLTPTTISNGSDSTLCCQLVAETAQDSFKICQGTSISLGRIGMNGLKYRWTDEKGNLVSTLANPEVSPNANTTYKFVVSSTDGKCAPDSAYVTVSVSSRITYDFARDTSFCDGDSVNFITRSNMASYQWLGKHINASTQSIKIKLADTIYFTGFDANSCTYRDTMVVKVFALPTFDLGIDTTVCENTPLTMTGPINMKTYNWNKGEGSSRSFTTLVEKKHTLDVVDNNGCKFSDSRTLTTKPFSAFSLGADDEFCEGGKFTILGPGALGNYIWNDTASSMQNLTVFQPGTYRLTAFNSFGCPYSDTIKLTTRKAPVFSLGNDFKLCIGTSKYLVGPAKMKNYSWASGTNNDSLRVTTSGTYVLTVTDSFNCDYKDTVVITDALNPVVVLGNDTTICIGDSLGLTPGTGFASYSWSTGSTQNKIFVKNKGKYTVTVVDANTCTGTGSINVDTTTCPSSVQDLNFADFKVYPIPVKGSLNLSFNSQDADQLNITIVNLAGQQTFSERFNITGGHNQLELNTSGMSTGAYFVQMRNSKGTSSFKVWIE